MNILSQFTISILLMFVLLSSNVSGQRKHHFGIDISKTLGYNLTSKGHGFIIEPIYLFTPKKSPIQFKLPVGYSSIERDHIFVNSNLNTKGYYLKPGLGFATNKHFSPFLNLILTRYQIENTYTIKGEYFGDYKHEYTHPDLFSIGIEPNIDFKYKLYKSLSILISLRFNYILYNSEDESFPVYYIPGVGTTHNERYSGGINVYLIW